LILGSGYEQLTDGTIVPSRLEQVRLDAGAIAYDQNLAPLLILINGLVDDPGGGGKLEENYLQQAYQTLTHDPNPIPESAIILAGNEKDNVNTAKNMDKLKETIAQRGDINSVIIIINKYSLQRALFDACERGIPATAISAEDLFESRDNNDLKKHLNFLAAISNNERVEQAKLLVRIWFPDSSITTWYFNIRKIKLNLTTSFALRAGL